MTMRPITLPTPPKSVKDLNDEFSEWFISNNIHHSGVNTVDHHEWYAAIQDAYARLRYWIPTWEQLVNIIHKRVAHDE